MAHGIHQLSIRSFGLALFVLLALCTPYLVQRAYPQTTTPAAPMGPKFAVFEYIKIEPGKGADYRKIEQEVWVPIHRERVKQGIIKSWSAWGIRFPGGADREYDRVIITTFDKFADVETPYPPALFTKVFPNTLAVELVTRTRALSRIVRSELVMLIDSVGLNPQPLPPRHAQLDFLKAEYGKDAEYVALARKYMKPVHQERVKRGILNSWQLFGARYPGGTNREYSHLTLNFFDKFEQIETPYPTGIFATALPNVNMTEAGAQLSAARKLVRSELLNLVEQVQ